MKKRLILLLILGAMLSMSFSFAAYQITTEVKCNGCTAPGRIEVVNTSGGKVTFATEGETLYVRAIPNDSNHYVCSIGAYGKTPTTLNGQAGVTYIVVRTATASDTKYVATFKEVTPTTTTPTTTTPTTTTPTTTTPTTTTTTKYTITSKVSCNDCTTPGTIKIFNGNTKILDTGTELSSPSVSVNRGTVLTIEAIPNSTHILSSINSTGVSGSKPNTPYRTTVTAYVNMSYTAIFKEIANVTPQIDTTTINRQTNCPNCQYPGTLTAYDTVGELIPLTSSVEVGTKFKLVAQPSTGHEVAFIDGADTSNYDKEPNGTTFRWLTAEKNKTYIVVFKEVAQAQKYKIALTKKCSCNADPGEFTSNLSEVTDTSTPIILTVKPNATHRIVSVGDKYTPAGWTNDTNYVGTVQIQAHIGMKEDTTFIATFTDVTPVQQPRTFKLTLNKSCKCGCSNAGTFVTNTGSTTVSQGTVVRLTAKPNDATTHKLEFIKVGSGYVYPEQLVNGDSIDVDVNMDATYEAVFAKKTTENPEVHACSASAVYTTDTTSHWKLCSVASCGKTVGEKGSHTGGTATNGGKCAVCQTVYVAQTVHTCIPSTTYITDLQYHYQKCSVAGCTETLMKGTHEGGTATNGGKCTVCKIVYVPQTVHTCMPSTTYITDLQYHYLKCSVAGCTETVMKGFHEGGTATNGGKCTVCLAPYVEQVVHRCTASTLYTTDTTSHWKVCSTVGCGKIVGEKGSHTGGTATNGGKCTVCKIVYVAQQHICSASTVYTTDATSHWKVCSAAGCGKIVGEKTSHTGGTATNGGKCTACGYEYVAQTIHTCIPSTIYITDLQYHYQKCSVAGCENMLMKGFHEGGTAANGGKCTVCGYAYLNVAIDPNHVHKYTISKLTSDGQRHYYMCEVCEIMQVSTTTTGSWSYESGDKCVTSPKHILNNGVCTIATCNYGKTVNPVTPPIDKSGWLFNDYAAKYKSEPGIDNAWAYDSLKNMKELGLLKGSPNATGGYDLLPNDKFVTLHLMSLMARILQSDGSKTTISNNVYGVANIEKSADWAVADYKYIMSRYGQIYGDKTGKAMVKELFPNNPNDWFAKVLTREEAGAMIGMLFGGSDTQQTSFPDWNSVGDNFKKGVSKAIELGIMKGDKNEVTGVTLINPKAELIRIQGIVLMENLYNVINDNGTVDTSGIVITQI